MNISQRAWQPMIVGGGVGVLIAIGFLSGILNSWSSRATDRLFLPHTSDPRIVVVAIDDTSINQIGRWPWSRTVHAELIKKIHGAGAKVIGYDVNFPEVSSDQDDHALADALKGAGNVVLPIELQIGLKQGVNVYDPKQILAPISLLSSAAVSTGFVNELPDPDGVVRRVPLTVTSAKSEEYPDSLPSFVLEIARYGGFDDRIAEAPVNRAKRNSLIINYPGAPRQIFATLSAVDILRDRVSLDRLRGAIVFVGATANDLHDNALVPTSNGVPMSGVEIHASTLDTLLSRRWLREVPELPFAFVLIVLSLIVAFITSHVRARWSVLLIGLSWFAMIVSGFILFDRGWIMDLIWPTFVLVFVSAAVTLERRVTADRERRELKAAFSRYVSPSVVDSVMKNPDKLKLGGDRKRMTVLFSDIRGFTTISEGLSPEKLVEILNRYLDRMTSIVFEHDGVLDKYIGDAVMAFWNAPLDQPDHALRAVKTALTMSEALAKMNAENAFDGHELHIGLGVNTGDMVVGNVGGETRFDYTVIGDNVNLGSRLESLTKEYGVQIIITEATLGELKKQVLTRRLDKVAVKGKKEPVVIYEVMELMETASPKRKKFAKEFEAALDLYFSRQFKEAVQACDLLLKTTPDDGATKTLLERAQHFMKSPPEEGWVGTWVYTKK
ncbi:adenylate/guanylate cyclase domain-containing protein [Patescibacteria group bacterium]|nr:adenylate/guanylate cyclase domain-containing protein [Patescibacteria group bacterium]